MSLTPRHDVQREHREQEASRQPAEFLVGLHLARGLLDLRRRQHADFFDAGDDARHLLDGAEGRAVGEREHQRRHDGRAAKLRREQRGNRRPPQRARRLLLQPGRRFRQERPDQDQRQRRNDAGDQRVAPWRVAAGDRGQRRAVGHRDVIGAGDHEAADRRERLRVAEGLFTLPGVGEDLRDPRDGRHELDEHADVGRRAEEQQHPDVGGEARGHRGERVDQDAPHQHAAPAEAVGQVAADQPERAADQRRDPEEHADPEIEAGRARLGAGQLADRGSDDERRHEDFVDVEGEPEGGNGADQPLQGGQARWSHRVPRSIAAERSRDRVKETGDGERLAFCRSPAH